MSSPELCVNSKSLADLLAANANPVASLRCATKPISDGGITPLRSVIRSLRAGERPALQARSPRFSGKCGPGRCAIFGWWDNSATLRDSLALRLTSELVDLRAANANPVAALRFAAKPISDGGITPLRSVIRNGSLP